MEKFEKLSAIVVPIDRENVDTDAIIPKQFLKSIKRTGFGPNLFDQWRYLDHGEPGVDNSRRPLNPDFVLNQARFVDAKILIARKNFGCGSSREHAPWALHDYGIKVILAPSYADIFYNNCFKNGLLPVLLESDVIDEIFIDLNELEGYQVSVDLAEQTISLPSGKIHHFEVDEFRKYCLLNGFDDIGLTLQHQEAIRQYEMRRRQLEPWLFEVDVST